MTMSGPFLCATLDSMTSPDEPEEFMHIHIPEDGIEDVVDSLLKNIDGVDLAKKFGDLMRAGDIDAVDAMLDDADTSRLMCLGFEVTLDSLLTMVSQLVGVEEEYLRALVFEEITTGFTQLTSQIADAKGQRDNGENNG